jgi:mannose-6-phosphate isomerase-like protein (cupin superfamily)
MNGRRAFLSSTGLAAAALFLNAKRATPNAAPVHRRVVTGVDAQGRSTIVSDGQVPAGAHAEGEGRITSDLWLLHDVPATLKSLGDPMRDYSITAWPPAGGAVARIATWPAGFEYPMHQSDTIDFIFVISGAIELIVEGGRTVLHPGDSVVQQGTKHGWRVVGEQPATFAGVLVSALR